MICPYCHEPEDDCYCGGRYLEDLDSEDLLYGFHIETIEPPEEDQDDGWM